MESFLGRILTRHSPAKFSKSPSGPKVEKVMHEWGQGELHSGSKHGPVVTNRKQAIAIALSEQRKQNQGGYK